VNDRRTKKSAKAGMGGRLKNPAFLRSVITGTVLAIAYLGVFSPLSARIDDTVREFKAQKKRLELVCDIERLRHEYEALKGRWPDKSDTNEWVEYVLGGIRRFPLKLAVLNPEAVRDIGPYKAVVLRIELNGHLPDMNGFLKWLEANDRLIRVDILSVEPSLQKDGTLVMHLTILGIIG
jgi:Type II secretion system (T2SS), protein M subtype b